MPVVEAKQLIQSAKFDWIDNIYQTSNELSLKDKTGQTSAVLTEVESQPARIANNTFKGWTSTIEVQLFYKIFNPNQSFNLLQAEIQLAKLFIQNGWNVQRSEGHVNDPFTNQITKTFYFRKTIGGI
ncbi:hypothetical protein BGL36_00065 [Fructilactobacillus lindneri]|uniref:Phage tail protein n=2 Tax=Fructilactobacillus lindneri TaxID=53444 RepID=A0A0R2K2G6_9LACO|nr:hypothetical protein IV52_GL001201 [Fructilactobacillus lindneri DSM 20690 = JCM 11027]POH07983.1 hypothetical protein BGL35_00030 [Fructilactobacillus lindneri]POH09054.1 hypothetical protein BGL36_00065 [Fructilactobacillus lindneri]POH24940.1 hypothetical protein BHU33_02695 [Fructilactobacillus lindneri DSM 20690 = JCM 11027]